MSVFGKIKDAIFGRHANAAEAPAGGQPAGAGAGGASPNAPSTPASTPAAPQAAPSGASPEPGTSPAQGSAAPGAPAQAPAQPAPAGAAASAVDVAAIMDKAVKDNGQKLDWRHSIVDMMKALNLDSSLSERKELAQELGYGGDSNDSAAMNLWLHKALMKKLAENGGKVPAELQD